MHGHADERVLKYMFHIIKSFSIALLLFVIFANSGESQVVDSEKVSQIEVKSKSGAAFRSAAWTLGPAAAGTALILIGAEGRGASELTVAIGIGIGTFGLTFGPGAGLSYAGSDQPYKGSWIRFAGCAVAGLGVAGMGVSNSLGDDTDWGAVALFIGGGGIVWLWSTIHDVVKASDEVERYNREHGFEAISIAPTYDRENKAVGLKLIVRI